MLKGMRSSNHLEKERIHLVFRRSTSPKQKQTK